MSILKKLRGDPIKEDQVNPTHAQRGLDSTRNTELLESGTYTVPETANRLGVHRDTLYRWISKGISPVPPLRMNKGHIRFSKAQVERFVAGHPE